MVADSKFFTQKIQLSLFLFVWILLTVTGSVLLTLVSCIDLGVYRVVWSAACFLQCFSIALLARVFYLSDSYKIKKAFLLLFLLPSLAMFFYSAFLLIRSYLCR